MAKARALDKRRKSIRNIRKITRTMELIATAKFKKAMDRAHAATAYTRRITQLVADVAQSGLEFSHPLLEEREKVNNAALLVITANRGLCGGYNTNVVRLGLARYAELRGQTPHVRLEISGKRGIGAFKFRGHEAHERFMMGPIDRYIDEPGMDLIHEHEERAEITAIAVYVTGGLSLLAIPLLIRRRTLCRKIAAVVLVA